MGDINIAQNQEFDEGQQPKKEEKKKPRWLTRSMAEEFSRRYVLITTFKEASVFFFFVIVVTCSTIGRRNPSMFYLSQAMKEQFLERSFKGPMNVDINFETIDSIADFWKYASVLQSESFYWESYYSQKKAIKETIEDDRKILFENKLLGVPRIRQVKVQNNSCTIHEYFDGLFDSCYADFNLQFEDKEPFGPGVGTAWTYSSESVTKSSKVTGTIGTKYSGGGFYQDLGKTKEESLKMIDNLRKNLWITRSTRVVFIDFSVYNANLNLFCICKLIFEFPPTGGVITSHTFRSVQLLYFINKFDYFFTACEYTVYLLALFYLSEELREIFYFRFRYVYQFWSYVDMMIIIMVAANLLTSIIVFPNVDDQIYIIKDNQDVYGNMEYLGEMKTLYNNFAASLLFFTYIKIFKYLNFNKTMGQLNNTLKRCALDILGFGFMFFIMFFAFAALGYLIFGSEVKDFSTFGIATFTLLRTILGDFDYQAIERSNGILAPIYFISYISLVFFVLLNMFLAIINDTYADVKTEIAIAPDEMQMTEFMKNEIYAWLQKCGLKFAFDSAKKSGANATISQIREALKKCGFNDLDVEMFFARYNIDPLAETRQFDMKSLLKELDANLTAIDSAGNTSLVQINDFLAQQDRLTMIEQATIKLGMQVDNLIKKLEDLDQPSKKKGGKT